MEAEELITAAAFAIRSAKYRNGGTGARRRKTAPLKKTDLTYAAAAIPAVLYALADATAEAGRFSSGALVQLAQAVEQEAEA